MSAPTLTLEPIGVVHSPFIERGEAPRQGVGAPETRGRIELFRGHNYEDALCDLDGFSHVWVIFWFHKNEGWRPKVLPPRSSDKRGVFSTRSPYRPNPIGMSLLELERVEGLTLHVRGLDLLDQTPVFDIKPFVPHADGPLAATTPDSIVTEAPASPRAPTSSGWLADPGRHYEVVFSERAEAQLRLLSEGGVELERPLRQSLALGPEPHAYRRIRREGEHMRIAFKDWRARFAAEGERIVVQSLYTGYREAQLAEIWDNPELDLHRAFVSLYGYPGH